MATSPSVSGYRFGSFALYVRSGELTRNGHRIRLQEKPCSLLLALMEHPRELITRSELRERLWPNDTFVDFEDGLNTAMRKLREALGDDPQSPRYIETVRGRGYRLLVDVEPVVAGEGAVVTGPPATAEQPAGSANVAGPVAAPPRQLRFQLRLRFLLAGCAIIASGGGLWYWLTHGRPVLSFGDRDSVLVADFANQAGDPNYAAGLRTALNVSLEQSGRVNVYSQPQTENALRLMEKPNDTPIAAAVGREICRREGLHALVTPEIMRAGTGFVVTAQLIDPATGVAVRSYAVHARDSGRLLDAVDSIAAHIRRDLGESRLAVHESDAPLPQVTTSSLAALEAYTDGAKLFGQGQVENAMRLYKAALAADPGFAMAHAAVGYADYSFYLNDPADGRTEFREALALSSRTTSRERAWIEARFAESQGRVADALRLYQQYIDRYPGDWVARYSYARQLRMNSEERQALPIYEELVREQSDDAGVWIELASAYSALDWWPQATQAYRKAFALDPHLLFVTNINHEYGSMLIENGQVDTAAQVFSKLLSDPDQYRNGERSLAFLDLYRGRYASARARLLLALGDSVDPFSVARIRYMLAVVAAGEGNHKEEIAQLDRIAASLDAIGPRVIYGSLLGQAYARAGEAAKAKQMLVRVAPLVNGRVPEQVAYAQLLKAEVAAATGDYQTAIEYLTPPETDDTATTATLTRESLGYIYQKMGKLDEAVLWQQQFVHGRGSHAVGWEPQQKLFETEYTLARDYQQKGDLADARAEAKWFLDQWSEADPGLPLLRNVQRLQSELAAAGH